MRDQFRTALLRNSAGAALLVASSLPVSATPSCLAGKLAGSFVDCDCALQALNSTATELAAGDHSYRQLPTLAPHKRVLGLDLTLSTIPDRPDATDDIFIGKYRVTGAPVIKVGSRTDGLKATPYFLDTDTGNSYVISHACLQRPELAYAGARWKLAQGDTIRMTFRSRLNAMWNPTPNPTPHVVSTLASNLHTHGAIVPPTQGGGGKPYGDYIFDVAVPASAPNCMQAGQGHGHNEVCGDMEYSIPIPPKRPRFGKDDPLATGFHPSGLFWVHPHPHGFSRPQLNGGTSSLITVGEIGDYVRVANIPKAQNVRHIQIKDAQVTHAPGAARASFNTAYVPGLCDRQPNDPDDSPQHLGECRKGDQLWLFTVSGMQNPKFRDSNPGEIEIWRIANASPNVTYDLMIVKLDSDAQGKPVLDLSDKAGMRLGKEHSFTILAVDGVGLGQNDPTVPRSRAPPNTRQNSILMMPGTRAEILLDGLEPGTYVLRQKGFNGGADTWPAIDLAELKVARAVPVVGAVKVSDPPPKPLGPPPNVAALKDVCRVGGISPTRKIVFAKADSPEVFSLYAGVYENGVDQEPTFFRNGGRMQNATVVSVWADLKSTPTQVGFGSHDIGSVCTHLDREETWILENWTTEIHNFHLHQSRFRLATELLNDPRYFSLHNSMTLAGATARQSMRAQSLDKVQQQLRSSAAAPVDNASASWGAAHHDSVPIPFAVGADCDNGPVVAGKNCSPGRVTVRIRFRHENQIGKFVYHCHILEHEDLGMMASIEVCDPKNPSKSCLAPKPAPARSGALAPQTPTGGAHRH